MLLALDVGNTNTTLGLYKLDTEKPELAAHWRVTSHRTQTVDEYGVFFVNLFEMHGMSPKQVTDIIIASVVPPVRLHAAPGLRNLLPRRAHVRRARHQDRHEDAH